MRQLHLCAAFGLACFAGTGASDVRAAGGQATSRLLGARRRSDARGGWTVLAADDRVNHQMRGSYGVPERR
jgi:hypothetical protein